MKISKLKAYCSVQSSLLEMWRFNEAAIEATTKEEVVEGINRLERRYKQTEILTFLRN